MGTPEVACRSPSSAIPMPHSTSQGTYPVQTAFETLALGWPDQNSTRSFSSLFCKEKINPSQCNVADETSLDASWDLLLLQKGVWGDFLFFNQV